MNQHTQRLQRHCLIIVLGLQLLSSGPATAQNSSTNDVDVDGLIKQLESGSAEDKLDAAAHFGDLGPYAFRAVPALSKALTNGDPALAYESLTALSSIGPLATAASANVAAMVNSEFVPLRVAAMDTLRHIGMTPPKSIPQIQSLAADPNDAVMVAAVRCLLNQEHSDSKAVTDAIPRLANALTNPRPSVRNAAASALFEIGNSVVPALKVALVSTVPTGRTQACEVAGRLGVAASDLIPILIRRLDDEDGLVVQSAATALGKIGGGAVDVVPSLEKLLNSNSAAIKAAALSALMDFGPLAQNAIPGVCRLTKDHNSIVRSAAVRALGGIGHSSQPVIDCLLIALEDAHGGVTIQAANALSQLGAAAVPALLPLLEKSEYRDLAVSVLGELGADAKAAVPSLLELLKLDDSQLRREVFIALAMIGPDAKAAGPALMKILGNTTAGPQRAGAAYVLANIGEQSCIPLLKAILAESTDRAPSTARAVAWALVTLEPSESTNAAIALPHLIAALSSEEPLVRKEALSAIGKLGSAAQPAAEGLSSLAQNDPDPEVRGAAIHALALLPEISDALLPMAVADMNDDNPAISNAARFLLGKMGTRAEVAASGLQNGLRTGAELDRIVAAWALVRVQPSADHGAMAMPFMVKALNYPNPKMRAEAARTLGVIGVKTDDVIAALKTAADDEHVDVAAAAKAALEQLN